MPKLLPYLWLVPVAVLFNGLFVALNYWNTRTKQFTRLSIAQVTSQLTTTSVSVGAGLAGHATFSAMIGASIGGQAVAVAALGTQIWCDNGRFLVESIRWREMVSGLKRHRNFPIFTTWSSLLNTASWQLPILMLGAFFSPVVVGFYALGFRILQMPMSLIGGAIRQVFLQRASAERASVELARLVQWLFQRLVVLTLLPSLILAVVGRDLFSVVLGANWAEAGIYAQILAPWALVWFISSPLSSLCYVLENQKEEMGIQAAIFLGRLLAIALGGLLGQPRMAIALFAVSGMLTYGYLIRILFGFVHLRARTVARECLGALRSSVVYMLPVLLAKALHLPAAAVLLASVAVLGVFFFRNREDLLILSNTS
jgi:O-antigen/teichoic acid export membrane protein